MNAETFPQGRQDGSFGIKIVTGRYCPRMMVPIRPRIAPASGRHRPCPISASVRPRGLAWWKA
jgi:hypothetical protein